MEKIGGRGGGVEKIRREEKSGEGKEGERIKERKYRRGEVRDI